MAAALGVGHPPEWRDAAFDRLWIIKLAGGWAALQDPPQRLMFGDSAE